MDPKQYPKWLSNVASSQSFQEIWTKSLKKIVSLPLLIHKNGII